MQPPKTVHFDQKLLATERKRMDEENWAIIELILAFVTSSVGSLSENNFVNIETFFMVHEMRIFIPMNCEWNFLIFVKCDLTPVYNCL